MRVLAVGREVSRRVWVGRGGAVVQGEGEGGEDVVVGEDEGGDGREDGDQARGEVERAGNLGVRPAFSRGGEGVSNCSWYVPYTGRRREARNVSVAVGCRLSAVGCRVTQGPPAIGGRCEECGG